MSSKTSKSYRHVARDIVAKFGGPAKLEAMSGISRGTIHNWIATGDIPEERREPLILLAKAHGIAHTPLDYVAYLIPIAA